VQHRRTERGHRAGRKRDQNKASSHGVLPGSLAPTLAGPIARQKRCLMAQIFVQARAAR
jgi:hypothetical protein